MTRHRSLSSQPVDELEVSCETLADRSSTGVNLSGSDAWSIVRRRFQRGLSQGVEVIELCNGPLIVSVLPTRGMGIWKAWLNDLPLGWNSPVRVPVHPQFVELSLRNGLGWLDGFNELMCRCGLAYNGPPGMDPGAKSPIESQLTLHGRIANLPAHTVDVFWDEAGPGLIGVEGIVDETTLFGPQLRLKSRITTQAGGCSFRVEDEVQNLGSTETELELLYHTNIGPPFLSAGGQFVAPVASLSPRDPRAAEGVGEYHTYLGPTPGYAEQAYFFRLRSDEHHQTEVLLHNADGDLGVSLSYHTGQLPFFTLWKCTQPEADGYVTGLEPGTNLPNFKSFEREQGRVIQLPPGAHYRSSLTMTIHDSRSKVDAARERIKRLQGEEPPVIHDHAAPPWAPGPAEG